MAQERAERRVMKAIRKCAWCGKNMGTTEWNVPEGYLNFGDEVVTSGICDECQEKEFARVYSKECKTRANKKKNIYHPALAGAALEIKKSADDKTWEPVGIIWSDGTRSDSLFREVLYLCRLCVRDWTHPKLEEVIL
jgi:hypothetical protein